VDELQQGTISHARS